MPPCIICDRAFEFARRIALLCDQLCKRGFSSHHIAKQLIRCGTSIGANAEEAQEGQTKADFIAKMCISRKEARELSEANQLLAMIRSAVRTARSSANRGDSS